MTQEHHDSAPQAAGRNALAATENKWHRIKTQTCSLKMVKYAGIRSGVPATVKWEREEAAAERQQLPCSNYAERLQRMTVHPPQ